MFVLPGSQMCLLYSDHGSVLGDRGCGIGGYRPSALGPLSIIWCPGFKTSLHTLLQGYKRSIYGRPDCSGRCGTVEFTQTYCPSGAFIGWVTASQVQICNNI